MIDIYNQTIRKDGIAGSLKGRGVAVTSLGTAIEGKPLSLADILEGEVDPKYYLSKKMVDYLKRHIKDFKPKTETTDQISATDHKGPSKQRANVVIQKTSGQTITIKHDETGCLQAGGANVRDKVPNVIRPFVIDARYQQRDKPRVYKGESYTLKERMGTGGGNVPLVFNPKQRKRDAKPEKGSKICSTLGENIHKEPPIVSIQRCGDRDKNTYSICKDAHCLSSNPMSDYLPKVTNGINLRRLTPKECERLQGFPDGWTEGVSDTQRYRQMGNAVTVNVVEFVAGLLKDKACP